MKKIIAANWKMNGTSEMANAWAQEFLSGYSKSANNAEVVVCPPDALISPLKEYLANSNIKLGGQDCHAKSEGAYTGESSANILKSVGCSHVIVGHSERRSYCGETNQIVCEKAAQAIKTGLIPIICIGETQEQRENGKTIEVINEQVDGSIPTEAKAGNFILAYEPVWAIGSGKIPTLDDIKQVHLAIIDRVSDKLKIDKKQILVLYGGSVKPENAREILALDEVAGVLVGGASLKAGEFLKIATSC